MTTRTRPAAKVTSVNFSRKLGSNVADLVSRLVISGTVPAIEEFLANAYDADATKVEVSCDLKKDSLAIVDNGSGMRRGKGLEDFYRLGDSPKVAEPLSPRGRRRIGKFGVGTILLHYLCGEYELVTARDGVKTVVHERFDEKIDPNRVIDGQETPTDKSAHGTALIMRNLKFAQDNHFSPEELKDKIQWHLPILPDFQIVLNDEPVTQKSIENATKFRIGTTGKHMGGVSGDLYLTSRATPMAGIYVYVNGRSIGDARALLGQLTNKRSLIDRVVGVINANELEHAILFDRGRFREDDPAVVELEKTLGSALAKMRGYMDESSKNHRTSRLSANRDAYAQKAVRAIASSGALEKVTKDTGFAFQELDVSTPGRFDPKENIIVLNLNHPSLLVSPDVKPQSYERAVLELAVDAVSLAPASEDGRRSLGTFLETRAQVWKRINDIGVVNSPVAKAEVSPIRVYDPHDLARQGTRSVRTIRDLVAANYLPGTDDEVWGKDFVEAERKIQGLVSLYDLLAQKMPVGSIFMFAERAANLFKMATKTRAPFVHDISRNSHPLYLVESTCADKVFELFDNPLMDLRRKDANPEKAFREFGDAFYTTSQLAQSGMDISQVAKVIDYAEKRRMRIEATTIRGGYAGLKYRDFVSALQSMRGNNEAFRRD